MHTNHGRSKCTQSGLCKSTAFSCFSTFCIVTTTKLILFYWDIYDRQAQDSYLCSKWIQHDLCFFLQSRYRVFVCLPALQMYCRDQNFCPLFFVKKIRLRMDRLSVNIRFVIVFHLTLGLNFEWATPFEIHLNIPCFILKSLVIPLAKAAQKMHKMPIIFTSLNTVYGYFLTPLYFLYFQYTWWSLASWELYSVSNAQLPYSDPLFKSYLS